MKIFETKQKNKLQYNAWGNLNSSRAVLFFHGFPGSHIQAKALERHCEALDFALIAVDRPGYGKSTFTRPGSYKKHLQDILELLESLHVKKFSVIGVSGGAPMAHLMAATFPDRIEKLAIVCGLIPFAKTSRQHFSPFQKRALTFRKWLPSLVVTSFINISLKFFSPEKKLQHFVAILHDSDRKALTAPQNRALILHSMQEARRQKAKGIVWDSALYAKDWLSLCDQEQFKKFPVHYYHGRKDIILSHQMSEYMNKMIPHSKMTSFENEGHYSLAFDRAEEILKDLEF